MRHYVSALAVLAALALPRPAPAQEAPAGDPIRGAAEFERVCSACHTIAEGARRRVGPNLFGIIGARIAARSDYPYSPAFRRSDIVWDVETLTEFLLAPARTVPGTKMDWAVADERTAADIIAYMSAYRR